MHLTAPFPYGLVQGEPMLRLGPTGNGYLMAPASTPIGCEAWTITPDFRGQTFHVPPDAGVGGGDCDLSVLPPVAGSTADSLAYSSLSLADLTVGNSTDGGNTWSTPNPVGSDIALDDRQWMDTDGSTIYMSYHIVTSNTILVAASTDGGLTYGVRGSAIDLAHLAQAAYDNELGPIVVDRLSSANPKPLYTIFVAPTTAEMNLASAAGTTSGVANGVYLAQSFDGGYTWTDTPIYEAAPGASLDHIFPALAIDAGGGLWAAFSDGNHIYVTYSLQRSATGPRTSTTSSTDSGSGSVIDGGLGMLLPESSGPLAWSTPVRVDDTGSTANLFPWLVGGGVGRAGLVWYAGTGTSPDDANQTWWARLAQLTVTSTGLAERTTQVSPRSVHPGALCTTGVTCTGDTRALLDFLTVAVSPDGRADVAWSDDNDGSGATQIYVDQQCSGASLWSGKKLPNVC